MYHLPGNVISATVGLVYIYLQPECELPSSTRFGQLRKFGKLELWAPSSPAIPKNRISARGPSSYSWLRVRFDLLSSINFRDISGYPKLDP